MSNTSKANSRIVRKRAEDISPPTPEHTAELSAMASRIEAGEIEPDTSDIPEQTTFADRLIRDEAGKLPSKSFLRDAIVAERDRLGWSSYQLHQAARRYSRTISLTATTEFLAGRRNVGVQYVEAMMQALGLGVTVLPAEGMPEMGDIETPRSGPSVRSAAG